MAGPPRDCVPALRRAGPHPPYILYEMVRWASALPIRHGWRGRTCGDLWDASSRGDWLLRYAQAAGADHRDLVRATAACVRPALRFVPAGEDRPRLAVEAAERWADERTNGNFSRARWAEGAALDAVVDAKEAVDASPWPDAAWGPSSAWEQAARAASETLGLAFVERAAEHAARAHSYAAGGDGVTHGDAGADAAGLACADAVRRLVPFLDLASVGGR